jgi:sRNA-binding protein
MGSEVLDRQWRDMLGILKTRASKLDLDYLRKWAGELKVTDLLERALKEASFADRRVAALRFESAHKLPEEKSAGRIARKVNGRQIHTA